MKQTLKKAAFKHGYLIIIAAWLYTISFIFTNYFAYTSSPGKVQRTLENYLATQEQKAENILKDTTAITNFFTEPGDKEKYLYDKQHIGLFGYEVNDVGNPIQVYWNTNLVSVNPADIKRADGVYTVTYQNGIFELIKHTQSYKGKKYILSALIPVHWDYFVENKYLKKEFAGYPNIGNLYAINTENQGLPVTNSYGKTIYHIEKRTDVSQNQPDGFSIILRLVALLFLMAFINAIASEISHASGFIKGYIFLVAAVIIFRILTYYFPIPFDFRRLELFDASIYASNDLHKSLGDLLINVVLFYWLVSFLKFGYPSISEEKYRVRSWKRDVGAIVSLLALVLFTYEVADIVCSLIRDSKIPFDVTNFFSLNLYTFICFVLLCILALAYFNLSHLLLLPAERIGVDFYRILAIVAGCGLLLLTFKIGEGGMAMKVCILLWLLLYLILLHIRKRDRKGALLNSSFFLFWVMFFLISFTILIEKENKNVEIQQRLKSAEALARETDPSGESLLGLAVENFQDSFFVSNFNRFKSEYSNKFIKDSLTNQNFSGYLNKYDTHIYTFDSSFQPLFNDDSVSYHIIKRVIENQGKKTSIDNVYYYENSADLFSYLYERTVKASDNTVLGYLFVIAKPKRYKSEALFPELFKQVKESAIEMGQNYSYAIYSKNKLINSFNNYAFPSVLRPQQMPKGEYEVHADNENSVLTYNAGRSKVVVIVRKNHWFVESVTLFAYMFCIFLATVALMHLAGFLIKARFRWKNIRQLFRFTIRTQIHATIIFVSVFSFIVIGIATISFFIIRFRQTNEVRLTKAIQVMTSEIASLRNQLIYDDVATWNDLGVPGGDLEKKIIEVSEIHNVDVNIFDADGTLTASTQPYIYNRHVLSDRMEPKAFYNLTHNSLIQYIQNEHVGEFSFLSIYVPVKDDTGVIYAYLNIPYLNSETELNQEISSFLLTLINLNVFIFVLAGAIALVVSNRITASFSLIGDKMREVSLGKMNEVIIWNKSDEIGVLVGEYNKMVRKLEESATILARSEREGAWREMARQVAHEIKNPLTPMKLSIQYLQRAINNNAPNVKELSQQVASMLVEQIDQLAQISSDFSQFANIGNVSLERFDLNELLASLVNLYSSDEHLSIKWERPETSDFVYADKIHINRLFTNLIKNGIEASEENEQPEIILEQYHKDGNIIVSVTDKGTGISHEMQPKIFTPNFTTKSSGTGLGLAICKGIVEKAKGEIWFETREGEGTTFFVLLPVVE